MAVLHSSIHRAALWISLTIFAIILFYGCGQQPDKIAEKSIVTDSIKKTSDLITADTLFKQSLYDSAFIYYKRAADNFEKQGKKKELIDVLLKISDLQRLKGDLESAMSIIDKAEKITDPTKTVEQRMYADVLHKKGLLLNNKGLFDSAISVLNSSLSYKIKLFGERDTSLSLNYNLLGISYFYKGEYDNALTNYTKAYEIALKRKNPEDADLAMFLLNIGIINAQKGKYEEAEAAFTRALKINEKLLKSDDPELSMINLNVGRLKALLNKDSEALDY